MELNIQAFLDSQDVSMPVVGELSESDIRDTEYILDGLGLEFPISYDGTLYNLGNELLLDLKIKYSFNTNCDRCLKPIRLVEESVFKGYFTRSEEDFEDSSDEYYVLENKSIQMDDILLSHVITSMPLKKLCSESCKGLCPQCGHDLNLGDCGCEERIDINPEFEKLLNLFDDEEV